MNVHYLNILPSSEFYTRYHFKFNTSKNVYYQRVWKLYSLTICFYNSLKRSNTSIHPIALPFPGTNAQFISLLRTALRGREWTRHQANGYVRELDLIPPNKGDGEVKIRMIAGHSVELSRWLTAKISLGNEMNFSRISSWRASFNTS